MIDFANIKYRLVLIDEKKKQYNITDYVDSLSWEENERELASRITFTVKNDKTSNGYLSSLIKPGVIIGVFARVGNSETECARGYVESWNGSNKNSGDTLRCTCYDELYRLQKSQDNRYYPSGTGTKSIICGILNDWGMPYSYNGPNATHGKQVFNNEYLSDIILDMLDDATKKGKDRYILRAVKGKVYIQLRGINTTVYVFTDANATALESEVNTSDLITRVKVVGQAEKDSEKRPVEATVSGQTKYGIRQRIYTRGSDETIEAAKSAAKEIINGEGKIKRTMSVKAPDLPVIRKGDLIYVQIGGSKGYYFVLSVHHDADSRSMDMDIEVAEVKQESNSGSAPKSYNVGDVVSFKGGTHYVSSYPDAKGYKASAGKAKITKKNGSGKAHPWHLIHTDKSSNVYGWVDNGTFS